MNEKADLQKDDLAIRRKEEDNQKLNQLINDYKRENSKCTQKIVELKEKLQNTKYK